MIGTYDCHITCLSHNCHIWFYLKEDAAREATKTRGADWEAGGEGALLQPDHHQLDYHHHHCRHHLQFIFIERLEEKELYYIDRIINLITIVTWWCVTGGPGAHFLRFSLSPVQWHKRALLRAFLRSLREHVGAHPCPLDVLNAIFIIIITLRWQQWRLSWNRKQKIHVARLNLKPPV